MSRFAIVTDGTCTLPSSYYADHDIGLVPLHVNFGLDSYRSGVDLSHHQFYELLATRREHPTTSQPSLGEFRDAYERVLASGTREILVITIDAALSGTYSVARSAAQPVEGEIAVVDSRSTSGGLGLLVSACARARRDGLNFHETVALAERLAGKPELLVYVDTLEFLKRSGRVPAVRALFGALLQIKPILRFANGSVDNIDRVRTRSRGIARLRELVVDAVGEGGRARMCVLHTKSPQEAAELAEWVQRTFHCLEFWSEEAGPVLGAHVGPGVVAVGFLKEDA